MRTTAAGQLPRPLGRIGQLARHEAGRVGKNSVRSSENLDLLHAPVCHPPHTLTPRELLNQ